MHLKMSCNICNGENPNNLVPDRAEDVWVVYNLCTVCLDELLFLFPIKPNDFFTREITGKGLRSIKKKIRL
jgi:hypothetical protein